MFPCSACVMDVLRMRSEKIEAHGVRARSVIRVGCVGEDASVES